jgi:hypothetical protein
LTCPRPIRLRSSARSRFGRYRRHNAGIAIGDTTKRQKAVVLSDWYGRRLTIHRYGSYVMLPLFVAQYLLGKELLEQKEGVWDGTRREPIDEDLATRTSTWRWVSGRSSS